MPAPTAPDAAKIIIDALAYARDRKNILLRAYIVMNSQIHLLAEAPQLGDVLRLIKPPTAPTSPSTCGASATTRPYWGDPFRRLDYLGYQSLHRPKV